MPERIETSPIDPAPPPRHVQLHRIKIDVLLWALEGLALRRPSLNRGRGWDEEQRAALIALVTATARLPSGRLEYGALARFAAKFGKAPRAVIMELHRLKQCGRLPWTRSGRADAPCGTEWKRAA